MTRKISTYRKMIHTSRRISTIPFMKSDRCDLYFTIYSVLADYRAPCLSTVTHTTDRYAYQWARCRWSGWDTMETLMDTRTTTYRYSPRRDGWISDNLSEADIRLSRWNEGKTFLRIYTTLYTWRTWTLCKTIFFMIWLWWSDSTRLTISSKRWILWDCYWQ